MLTGHVRSWLYIAQTPLFLCAIVIGVSQTSRQSLVINQAVHLMLATLIIVVGLYVFIGNSGVFSFGHAAFAMVGAYAAIILTTPVEQKEVVTPMMLDFLQDASAPSTLAILTAGACAAILGLAMSVSLSRLSGLSAGLATFALLLIVYSVANNLTEVTNGTSGLTGPATAPSTWHFVSWALFAIILAWAYQLTKRCQRLRASREDEIAAHAVGINVYRERAIAFGLSAFIAGIGGALYGEVQGTVTPDTYYLTLTVVIIAMLVVGGVRSLSGAVIGTILISALNELTNQIEFGLAVGPIRLTGPVALQEVVLSLVLLAVLLMRPAGLIGSRELVLPRMPRCRRAGRR